MLDEGSFSIVTFPAAIPKQLAAIVTGLLGSGFRRRFYYLG